MEVFGLLLCFVFFWCCLFAVDILVCFASCLCFLFMTGTGRNEKPRHYIIVIHNRSSKCVFVLQTGHLLFLVWVQGSPNEAGKLLVCQRGVLATMGYLPFTSVMIGPM